MTKCRVEWVPSDSEVRLFNVSNTSHNSLLVLASTEEEAMSIAQGAGHIYGTQTIHALNYDRMCYRATSWEMRDHELFGPLVEQAILERKRATVEFDGDGIWIGNSRLTVPV